MMPKMNGLDVLQRLKATPGVSHIPVIVLTNLLGSEDAEAAMQAGAVRYVGKSDYSPKEVVDIVESVLQGYIRDAIPEAKSTKAGHQA
jgi:CheY-like chemotaxis protein